MNRFPTEVTVIVNSVNNIKPKKAGLKFCVIFAVGSVKFRTDQVANEAGNPVFNSESSLQVENPKLPLTLCVTEKKEKEFYGQLVVALDELPTARSGVVRSLPLQPHKKCPTPTATMQFEAWISKTLHTSEITINTDKKSSKAPLKGLKKKLSNLKNLSRKGKDKNSLAEGNMKQAYSCMDISNNTNTLTLNNNNFDTASGKFYFGNDDDVSRLSFTSDNKDHNNPFYNDSTDHNNPFLDNDTSFSNNNNPFDDPSTHDAHSLRTASSAVASKRPEITGVSPNSALITGGRKVVIRGNRLGNCKEDIIGLLICGSNVLGSLEYYSSSKIACTTNPWKLCTGHISLETQSGGKSLSAIEFTFKCDLENESIGGLRIEGGLKAVNRSKSSAHLLPQHSSPTKKSSKLSNKLTLGLSNSFLSRSLMNLNEPSVKKASLPYHVVTASVTPPRDGSYQDLGVLEKPSQPPVVHITPIMVEKGQHKNKDTIKIDSNKLKELEQQLFTWQKCANNLTSEKKLLESENKRLKSYIDNIVCNIMEKCPNILQQGAH